MRLLFLNRSMLVVLIISCVLRWSGTVYAAPGDIETIVGGGPADGSVATDVSVEPEGVFVDNAGNIYVADRVNNRVYKVDGVGQISTIAGDGTRGYFGDGGLAVNAQVHHPSDVFVDGAGNIYIADTDNHCIRKVDTAGIITTVAGDGLQGDSGDGGPATSAKLRHPNGVFVDATGNIYIAGRTNDRIRKVDTAGIITTVAGNGTGGYSGDGGVATSAQLNSPYDVFVDGVGNIYIADGINNRIRKVDTAGIINTVAGNGANGYSGDGGAATSAALGSPSGVFVDGVGNIYIADGINNRIRKVDTAGIITTVAGNGGFGYSGDGGAATNAQLNTAARVSVDNSGVIYIADRNNRRLRKVDGAGTISTIVGNGTAGYSGDGGAATSAQLSTPYGVAVDAAGNVYLADRSNHIVRKVDSSGAISTVAGSGGFGYSGDGGAATNAEMRYPHGVAVDGAGNIYIADVTNHSIRKVDSAGNISTVAGTGTDGYSGDGGAATSAELASPTGVSVDGSGNLYIAYSNNHRVRKVDIAGNISTIAGTGTLGYSGDGGAATSEELNYPSVIAIDSAGNIYIADRNNHRIRKIDGAGNISTIAGTGASGYSGDGGVATNASIKNPWGVAVDGSDDLYIADSYNHSIRKVDGAGIISTVAGTGIWGYLGDGSAAINAQMRNPLGVVVDAVGNIYIADTDNARVRKVVAAASV